MNIGLIYCGWGTKDLVDKSLEPWVEFRAENACKICAVSVRFAGFEGEDDGTQDILRSYWWRGDIDKLIDSPDNIPETTARGMALQYLKEQDVDVVIQWDSDEIPTKDDLNKIIHFVENTPDIAWYRISYANLVFDEKTYLAEPFTPPRIHRMRYGGYQLHSFSGDNDIQYGGVITRDLKHQDNFPSITIPWICAAPRHYSWLNNERSRLKQAYQWKRWNHCSFSWDDSKGGLIFNPNLPEPKVIKEY